jgi:hypothetical protein
MFTPLAIPKPALVIVACVYYCSASWDVCLDNEYDSFEATDFVLRVAHRNFARE